MKVWTPLETAWPGLVAAAGLGLAVAAGGWKWLRPSRAVLLPGLALVGLALVVRLGVVPAWSGHVFDGHEAEYWDLFRGVRAPNRGGTVLYPAMQWLWWGLGRVLPHHPRVPVVVMSLTGAASVAALGAALGRLGGARVGWAAALLVALHPVHAAWSSSAYNVIVPFFAGTLVLWSAAVVATDRRAPQAVAWLGAMAWVLVVATRLDAAVVAAPAGLLVLLVSPDGAPLGRTVRARLRLLPALGAALLLGALAAWPLLWPGEVPGAGERALSFGINVAMADYMVPFDGPLGLALLGLGAVLAGLRWPTATLALVGGGLLNHLLLASFDDYSDRHALGALPGVAWAVGAGGAALASFATRRGLRPLLGALLPGVAFGLCLAGLVDLRERFYGSEEAYAEALAAPPWAALPRVPLASARQDAAAGGVACGWIAEDPRVAAEPLASHFNVLRPAEAAALRGPSGCLRWCADVQDWRWSSRSVRDRALRMARLYSLRPVAVVRDPGSGYSCLVLEVGARRCCGTEPRPDPSGALGGRSPEQDGRPAFPSPPLP